MPLKHQLGVEDWVRGAADGQEEWTETQLCQVTPQIPERLALFRF